ncbi:MAG TPA: hypothetical protein PK191_05270 [Niabella sp.]|nr:hypothetical protein [Niabella sp.]HOZ97547.1 hypothetical protein [Niabella sp.]HQW15635.1 hypothetical protein [Niabella sp.]HQX20778.1 hypothetical protein [Niabella sp.]HQX41377.1 hypothetical protein [Niabella sp.]
MEKELFEKTFIDNLNKNFQSRSKCFDFQFYVFSELGGTVFEINKCLILEFHRASITLTNNLLERLLKLSLIYDDAGIGPKPVEDWGTTFEEPNKKYSSISLGNSIEKCRKLDLITEDEKIFLFETIRELMRNGFSHADSSKILNGIPDETTMFQGSFSNPTDIKPVTVNQKVIPFIQAIHIENFAKENSANYFDYVFELIKKIDQRLIDRNEKNRHITAHLQ